MFKFWMSVMIVIVVGFAGELAYSQTNPTDSTSVNPIIAPPSNTKVTVQVMHYFYPYTNINTNFLLPNPVNCSNKGTLITGKWYPTFSYQYNPAGGNPTPTTPGPLVSTTNNFEGLLYYICAETYWTNDPYYQALVAASDLASPTTFIPCQYTAPTLSGGTCSITAKVPPIIRVAAPVPAPLFQVGAGNNGNVRFYDVMLWINGFEFGYATSGSDIQGPAWIHQPLVPIGAITPPGPYLTDMPQMAYGWYVLDPNPAPLQSTYINGVQLNWEIVGPNSTAGDATDSSWSNQTGAWGTYACYAPPNGSAVAFQFLANSSVFGQSCTFTCNGWTYLNNGFPKNGGPYWPPGYAAAPKYMYGTMPTVTCSSF